MQVRDGRAQANALAVVHAELIFIHPFEVGGYFFRLTRGLRTALEVLGCPSTAWIPSIAEDVTTDRVTILSRVSGSRR